MERIAIFTNETDIRYTEFRPRELFIVVRSIDDVRGQKFSGIILQYDWYLDSKKAFAYEQLMIRQTELNRKP